MLGPYSKPLGFVWCCKTCSLSSNWFNSTEVKETVQRYHWQMILSYCYYYIFTFVQTVLLAYGLVLKSWGEKMYLLLILLGKNTLKSEAQEKICTDKGPEKGVL